MLHDPTSAPSIPYDRIADAYDDRWTPHFREPQERLTRDLGLRSGERVLDLGCGTGVDTLDMLERVRPGEVVAVDCSSEMLKAAEAHAGARSLSLTTICAPAEQVVEDTEPSSFDVVSLRFCLAYLPWRYTLPTLGRMLRTGGRVGLLTNLATSTPQAYALYLQMTEELGIPPIEMPVPETIADICHALSLGGLAPEVTWTHRHRLWFPSGLKAVEWMRESGYATHPMEERFDPEVVDHLSRLFGERLDERYRQAEGVPLDFEFAGVVAARA